MSGEAREETTTELVLATVPQRLKHILGLVLTPCRSTQRWVNRMVHKAGHRLKLFGLYFNFGLCFTQVWSE